MGPRNQANSQPDSDQYPPQPSTSAGATVKSSAAPRDADPTRRRDALRQAGHDRSALGQQPPCPAAPGFIPHPMTPGDWAERKRIARPLEPPYPTVETGLATAEGSARHPLAPSACARPRLAAAQPTVHHRPPGRLPPASTCRPPRWDRRHPAGPAARSRRVPSRTTTTVSRRAARLRECSSSRIPRPSPDKWNGLQEE